MARPRIMGKTDIQAEWVDSLSQEVERRIAEIPKARRRLLEIWGSQASEEMTSRDIEIIDQAWPFVAQCVGLVLAVHRQNQMG